MGACQGSLPLGVLALLQALVLAGAEDDQAIASAEGRGAASAPSQRWRVVNLEPVADGWTIGELRIFSDAGCINELTKQKSLTWETIASGSYNSPPARALDGATWTEWRAQCYKCQPRDAWLGVAFSAPVRVLCIRMWQWGRLSYKSSSVMLERWDTSLALWEPVLLGSRLDGGRWDQMRFVQCDYMPAPEYGRVQISNLGYYPSDATFSCSGMRILTGLRTFSCGTDGTWGGSPPRCWAILEVSIFIAVVLVLDVAAFMGYYFCVITRKASPIEGMSYIPEENMGEWSQDLFGACTDPKARTQQHALLQFFLCPCCRVADTWHGMGQLPFAWGAPLLHLFFPLLPCLGALVRGSMRDRLHIRATRMADLFVWVFCIPCVAVQEARTSDAVCTTCAEEIEAMKQDRLKREEILEKQHKAAYEEEDQRVKSKFGHSVEEHLQRANARHATNQHVSTLAAVATGQGRTNRQRTTMQQPQRATTRVRPQMLRGMSVVGGDVGATNSGNVAATVLGAQGTMVTPTTPNMPGGGEMSPRASSLATGTVPSSPDAASMGRLSPSAASAMTVALMAARQSSAARDAIAGRETPVTPVDVAGMPSTPNGPREPLSPSSGNGGVGGRISMAGMQMPREPTNEGAGPRLSSIMGTASMSGTASSPVGGSASIRDASIIMTRARPQPSAFDTAHLDLANVAGMASQASLSKY